MLQTNVADYFKTLSQLLQAIEVTDKTGNPMSLEEGTDKAVSLILEVKASSRKVVLAGNGGSSAIVSHVQNDLCKMVGARAMVFTEQPLLTAMANDEGYGSVFEQPIHLWGEPGDLLITVSSSGNSENIVRAIGAAKNKGCQAVTMSGFDANNTSRAMGDLNFYVASHVYGYVETAHTALAHFLTNKASVC